MIYADLHPRTSFIDGQTIQPLVARTRMTSAYAFSLLIRNCDGELIFNLLKMFNKKSKGKDQFYENKRELFLCILHQKTLLLNFEIILFFYHNITDQFLTRPSFLGRRRRERQKGRAIKGGERRRMKGVKRECISN